MITRRAMTICLMLLVAVTTLLVPLNQPAAQAAQVAATGPTLYWGAYIDGQPYGFNDPPWDTRAMDAFEANTKKKMAIFHWGQQWMKSDGTMAAFPTNYFDTVRNRGSIPMLNWLSMKSGSSATTQPDFQLNDIYGGKYDSYITSWATAAKAWGKPFFLRFDHEMNGYWYAWGEAKTSSGTIVNGNQTGDYVKAWRHVHDIFKNVGATNATWVWCPNISSSSTVALSGLYPGDTYVDWTCLDGYNRPEYGWLSFSQIFTGSGTSFLQNSYQQVVNIAPNKPMMIGETASMEAGDGGAKKAAWIKDMLLTQIPINFPKIKAVVWFNWNDSSTHTYRIETSQASIDGTAQALASPLYAANQFASLTTSPIQPLVSTALSSQTATFVPSADTYITSATPTSTAGGTSTTLFSSGSPSRTSYIKFDLSTLAGKTLASVKLRIHTTNNTSSGSVNSHSVKLVDNVSWSESSVSYNSPVAVTSTVLGTLAANSTGNTWYEITLTPSAIQPKVGAQFAIAIQSTGNDGLQFDAREATNKPQLVLTY